MAYQLLDKIRKGNSIASIKVGSNHVTLVSKKWISQEVFEVTVPVEHGILSENGAMMVPANLFKEMMQAYVTIEDGKATIEHCGNVAMVALSDVNESYVRVEDILPSLNNDYLWNEAHTELELVIEARDAKPRELTSSEEKLPYAKYFHEYWNTPYHERADVKAWANKFQLFQLTTMKDPSVMLHVHDARKLLDRNFRENEWQEGWTLFPDGCGVMCTKTEFPGTTAEMFQWWFAWHPIEDIRYMMWYPPAHYGIRPTLELRGILADDSKSMYEKTHGGNPAHMVYESTPIDSLSKVAAGPKDWNPIPFQNIEKRCFTHEDLEEFDRQGIVAMCGGSRMLHFFVNKEDGTGGTLYTHFWYGLEADPEKVWRGVKGAPDDSLIPMIMNIAQHATKEFAQLATFLPRLYAEEGHKPLI